MSQKFVWTLFLQILLLCTVSSSPAATLHAIVIADTNATQGAVSFSVDLRRMKELAKIISSHAQLSLKIYEISGSSLNRDNVVSTLERLSVGSNDVVIFYYAGHGGRFSDKSSVWPMMDIQGGALDLMQVKTSLEQKNPRFIIVLADTCNNFNDSFGPVWGRGGSSSRGKSSSSDGYRQLFLDYQGHVFASGSKPGQYSWGNAQYGGFFTDAFLKNLNEGLESPNPNWYTIMKRTEAPITVQGKGEQNPQSQVDIRPARSGISSPIPDQCYYFYKPNGVLCCKGSNGTTCEQSDEVVGEKCPRGSFFMKPGGITCCKRPTGDTCTE